MDIAHKQFVLEVFSDQVFVKDIVKGVLHTIFFHRYIPPIKAAIYTPTASVTSFSSRSSQSLPVPLPAIVEPPEISAAIEVHANTLVAQLTSSSAYGSNAGSSRGEINVQFFDRKRRKTGVTGGWLGRLGGVGQTDEEICWEEWVIEVVVARPRSEADRIKVRKAMESSLQKTAMKVVNIVNRDKEHIPLLSASEPNPFPYRIMVNPKQQQGIDRGIGTWV